MLPVVDCNEKAPTSAPCSCFWFRWPSLLIWLIEVSIVCNSSCLTICVFVLSQYITT